ncbi:type IV pilus modification protein PilV [Acinetobacter sp. ANC 4648]|uniref:type IV pilus modification protein PilV n=1 Tax=Acinetobacter sp. ANC 4648 TaxID=1977875 RepID=UPI000A34E2FD|nr:type IV pilus modification protein PilV [Acinetobacter sp. ANC 4648]OTG80691.1 type IV pilus modification protein PilV [Acinetobacter sp. ANC 4648]
MIIIKHQKGVGLMEVLVALLLLAIGVLGYTVLQLRAVDASSEALSRSQGMLVLRGLAENIRANPDGQTSYPTAVREYTSLTSATKEPTASCLNPAVKCTPQQMATYDAYSTAQSAFDIGMHITMADCPGVSAAPVKRQCLFIAWGDTTLSATSTTADVKNCMSSAGIYTANSKCLMMEAY